MKIKSFQEFINESLNEAGDVAYWKQYEKGSPVGEEDYAKKVAKNEKELDPLFDEVVMWWDTESESPNMRMPFGQSRKCEELRDVAKQYLRKYKSINGRVIDAMVSQNYI
jgi:DNA replicative helicase MCM subunit Mcm2 (Cdc46/Mcm family)